MTITVAPAIQGPLTEDERKRHGVSPRAASNEGARAEHRSVDHALMEGVIPSEEDTCLFVVKTVRAIFDERAAGQGIAPYERRRRSVFKELLHR